jgi:hypothetical protein
MSRLDIYKKQAKQLVRWHREGNHSIGGRIRGLTRYQTLADREALALEFPLREAQEIIALEAGYASWAALKVAVANGPTPTRSTSPTLRLTRAIPVIFVANVEASAEFFKGTLGFSIDFLHGEPPFYGSVSRDGACVHLKFVHQPVLTVGTQDRDGFIGAFIEVENVKALYTEYLTAGAIFDQKLKKQAWGGRVPSPQREVGSEHQAQDPARRRGTGTGHDRQVRRARQLPDRREPGTDGGTIEDPGKLAQTLAIWRPVRPPTPLLKHVIGSRLASPHANTSGPDASTRPESNGAPDAAAAPVTHEDVVGSNPSTSALPASIFTKPPRDSSLTE